MTHQTGKLDLNWVQTAGSALAALSSAVLLSTLGATGTVIGAAVGSIVATVGGSVYSYYLSVSRERMAAARSLALRRASRAQGRPGAAPTGGTEAVTRTIAASPDKYPLLAASAKGVAPGATRPGAAASATGTPRLIDGNLPGTRLSLRQMLRGLRWKPALAASAGIFVLVMGVIVSMELATGRALSSYTGGSSADGPSTSLALLGSSSDTDDGGSATSETAEREADTAPGDAGDTGDTGSQSTGDTGSSTGSSSSDTEPQTDTSTTDPDTGATPAPSPEPAPEETVEPAPEPTPAPTVQAPAEAPAPTSGGAVSSAEVAPAL